MVFSKKRLKLDKYIKRYPIFRSINTADKYDNFTFWKIMSTYIYSCQKLVVFLSAATGKVIEDLIKVQKALKTYWYGVQAKAKQPLNLMSRTY